MGEKITFGRPVLLWTHLDFFDYFGLDLWGVDKRVDSALNIFNAIIIVILIDVSFTIKQIMINMEISILWVLICYLIRQFTVSFSSLI